MGHVSCSRMPLSAPSGIFKAYDIRGLLGEEIDGDLAEEIGRAFARVLGALRDKPTAELRVGLGRDMRIGAAELSDRYRDGLMAEGVHVVDAGMVGTEMLYFLVGAHGLDGGLMCTASHNPRAYTGAKLVREGGRALSGDAGIGEVAALVAEGLPHDAPGGGSTESVDIAPAYHARLRTFLDPAAVRPLRIVLDGGSGMAAHTIGPVLEELPGLELVRTFWEPDGAFPDHEPNPLLEENRRAICEAVRGEGADLGIAFDGDADRCFFIDEAGRFVDGDFLCALLARQVLAMRPGADILYDVRASWAVPDTVREAGGRPHLNRVGHAFFKARMHEMGAAFGGEVSGHYYFADFYNADSGAVPALLILQLLGGTGRTLRELLEPYRSRYFISGEVNSEVADPVGKLAEIRERYADAGQTELDGVSVEYADWHFNVRCSNTEPLMRLCLESLVSPAHMEARRDDVLAILRS
jgi:phosphomannomutase